MTIPSITGVEFRYDLTSESLSQVSEELNVSQTKCSLFSDVGGREEERGLRLQQDRKATTTSHEL